MTPEEIRQALYKRRKTINVSTIAKNLSCSKTAVVLVIDRKTVSKRIMAAVAAAIERPVGEVFPEYFHKES